MRTSEELSELKALLALSLEAMTAAQSKVQALDQVTVLPQISVTTSADTYHSLTRLNRQRLKEFHKHHCELDLHHLECPDMRATRTIQRSIQTNMQRHMATRTRKPSMLRQFLGWIKPRRNAQVTVKNEDLYF